MPDSPHIKINPTVLTAIKRQYADRLTPDQTAILTGWQQQQQQPTAQELETFSKAARIPLGYFFLDELPKPDLPPFTTKQESIPNAIYVILHLPTNPMQAEVRPRYYLSRVDAAQAVADEAQLIYANAAPNEDWTLKTSANGNAWLIDEHQQLHGLWMINQVVGPELPNAKRNLTND